MSELLAIGEVIATTKMSRASLYTMKFAPWLWWACASGR